MGVSARLEGDSPPRSHGSGAAGPERKTSGSVDFICDEFELARRHESTLAIFASWIKDAEALNLD